MLVSKLSSQQDSVGASSRVVRLSKRQLQIIEFIYGYRFVSTRQVQLMLGKKQIQQAQQRLNTLLVKQYIGRNFSKIDRLTGKYASYYLMPKGIQLLRLYRARADYGVLRNIYKDRTASARFIAHCLSIGDSYADLSRMYGKSLEFITKSQLRADDIDDRYDPDYGHSYDYFPQPLPDACLAIFDANYDGHEFLLEVWHDNVPFFVYRNRIKYYMEYVDEEKWKKETGSALPPVLLVCESPTLQRRVQRFLKKQVDEIYTAELKFLITNRELMTTAQPDSAIWAEYDEALEKFTRRTLGI